MSKKLKKCSSCGKEKKLSDFDNNKFGKDGYYSKCRECKKITRMSSSIQAESRRRNHLKSLYNMTLEEYDEMYEKQNGVCAICGRINENGKRLYVDHNHKTGKIRALLCNACNTSLGLLEEDKKRILSLLYYLEVHEGDDV